MEFHANCAWLNHARYDAVNRLTRWVEGGENANTCSSSSGTWCQEFSYDARGNVVVAAEHGLGTTPGRPGQYGTDNRVITAGWSYDGRGNVAAAPAAGGSPDKYLYDGEDRVATYCRQTAGACADQTPASNRTIYRYDADGRRVVKEGPSGRTVYVYDAAGNLAAEYGAASTAGGTHYVTSDSLGSTRVTTNSSGGVVSRIDYEPFGREILVGAGNARFGVVGYRVEVAPQKFTGKERDAETGLDYFGARYYSGAQWRFTSPDEPFADQHVADPQSWNLYSYVRNNPLRFVDPTGNAIELTGDEEERKKALAAIQAALGNSKASANLYINPELDKKGNQTGRFFVGINGDASAFAKAGGLEAGLAGIIADKNIVQFGLGDKTTIYDDSAPNFLRPLTFLSTQTLDVGERFGGGVTHHGSITMSGFIQSIVDPTDLRDRTAAAEGIPGATLGETVAHELIGHAGAFLRGQMGAPNNQRAVNAENAARARGGPARRQKRNH